MTPPLATRHNSVSLRSPASSPNLSVRSVISSPPTIKIEDSVLEFTDSASDTDLPINESDSSSSSNQNKLFQLPPVNTWVPKGESLFTSILDSRSPQVYRRTTPTGKTASYPPSPQNGIQGSRVSWPQVSQAQPLELDTNVSDSVAVDSSKHGQVTKSPKLLTKCTSFDLERSKPFPSRSSMTSPMLLRKHISAEESDTVPGTLDQDSKEVSRHSEIYEIKHDSEKIEEDDENGTVRNAEDVPQCESVANTSHHDTTVEAIAGDSAVKYLVMSTADEFDASRINESLEDPSIPETDIVDDYYIGSTTLETQDLVVTDVTEQSASSKTVKKSKGKILSSDKDKGAKLKKSKTSDINGHLEGKNSPKSDKKTKNLKKGSNQPIDESSSRAISKSSSKDRSSEKSRSKTPVSTMRSALLTSAAKLKSIGKKNPVTLLSYKSHSISIPDHSRKAYRPSSVSERGQSARSKTSKIHQTESSPTVLVTSHEVRHMSDDDCKEILNKPRSVTPPLNKSTLSKRQKASERPPVLLSVQGLRKSSVGKSAEQTVVKTKPTSVSEDNQKTEKSASSIKSSSGKQVKSSQAKSSPSAKQVKLEKHSQSSHSSVAPRPVKDSPVSQSSKTSSKTGLSTTKEDRSKVRQSTKRGSISSVNSDSSKHTDHFRDCCHGRRKTDKK
ncbi:uncharacterized protein LOC128555475 isoform X2 [Mercenaria mercenaria]|nr:uncharacterized protein LOC128555475 isoform X2 [Mercenaria mercenaria]XP_053393765.1 uncharacterized protein LOC128555475 isoform X2 [Mercenaria mercenaria]XP_053393766.1 uncharacterized protein LOC128555475 isoform X2 [Mercenaria mercenaria]XP_053393767.1 uncharacterized protein LOC128555475 isoform X2 [Mercenaria mercenaria]XP_053393768.1 uncharacterized protein LOC128555475 isoform X2 [Mercenaria mercenaria]XP_053393769.1 uncharacterized protein LOC128555475 isoform X2 [Mercenaria merce